MAARAPEMPITASGGPPRLTDAEWIDMDEDEPGELVDGVLEEEEVPDAIHESMVAWLVCLFRNWLAPRGGFAFGSELKYLLRKGRGRKPDVSVFLPGSKPPPGRGAVRRAPDLIVEIVSPRARDVRRDRIAKRREYAAFGVRSYWLVDPAARTLEIFELGGDGRYVLALDAEGGRLDAVPGCEGLVLDLDELWAELDRLGEEEPEEDAEG